MSNSNRSRSGQSITAIKAVAGALALVLVAGGCLAPPPPATRSTTSTPLAAEPPVGEPAPANLDLAYGPAPSHRLDLYLPHGDGPHPLVVWAHGGAWTLGDKNQLPTRFRELLLHHGYAVASVNYRLAGAPPIVASPWHNAPRAHPVQLLDYKNAVRWLISNAGTYDLDPRAVFGSGHSAGGHLAVLAVVSTNANGVTPVDVTLPGGDPTMRGAIAYGAPIDLYQAARTFGPMGSVAVRSLMGCLLIGVCHTGTADPRTYLDESDAPVALVFGNSDVIVPPSHGWSFAAAASVVGFEKLTVRGELGIGHEEINSSAEEAFLVEWLDDHLP